MTSPRTQKEKAYEDDQDFHVLINPDLTDEKYNNSYDMVEQAFLLLKESDLIVSKSQFKAAILGMKNIPVPICEAAAICQVTREYFRVLEKRGKIKIIRNVDGKKCFIMSKDILRYLKGKV